jgi:cytidylate kinase
MENLLYEYMNRRFNPGHVHQASSHETGPVITISRQAGCGASKLAHDLCMIMNAEAGVQSGQPGSWHFINHEILEKLAEKLNLEPQKLDKVITDKNRGVMDEILEALSSHSHKSDRKIIRTTQEVIKQFAEQGNVIIVGRGGAVVSQHIQRSLHIRFEAPLEWRIEAVMKKLEYSREYSKQYIRNVDEQREMYVSRLAEGVPVGSLYDLVLPPNRFEEKQLIEIILKIAALKGIR